MQKDPGYPPPVVYNQNWDSDMIYGCVCESGFFGADCSQSITLFCMNVFMLTKIFNLGACPQGDDPLTGFAGDKIFGQQFNEKQTIFCMATVCEMLPAYSDFTLMHCNLSREGLLHFPFVVKPRCLFSLTTKSTRWLSN